MSEFFLKVTTTDADKFGQYHRFEAVEKVAARLQEDYGATLMCANDGTYALVFDHEDDYMLFIMRYC